MEFVDVGSASFFCFLDNDDNGLPSALHLLLFLDTSGWELSLSLSASGLLVGGGGGAIMAGVSWWAALPVGFT